MLVDYFTRAFASTMVLNRYCAAFIIRDLYYVFENATYSETLPTEVAEIATSISPELALTETVVLAVHAAYAPPTTM